MYPKVRCAQIESRRTLPASVGCPPDGRGRHDDVPRAIWCMSRACASISALEPFDRSTCRIVPHLCRRHPRLREAIDDAANPISGNVRQEMKHIGPRNTPPDRRRSRPSRLIALTSIPVLLCAFLTVIGAPVARASVIQPRIEGGGSHFCILNASGGVQCWGQNLYGQLGDGTYITKVTPTDVAGLGSGIAQVAAGLNHTCAMTTGGALKCWGDNNQHQLGDPGAGSSPSPINVPGYGPGTVQQVAAGGARRACSSSPVGSIVGGVARRRPPL